MKITDVILFEINGHWYAPIYPPGDRQAHQLDIYPEFNAQDWGLIIYDEVHLLPAPVFRITAEIQGIIIQVFPLHLP
jgi:hypothetical protein